MKIENPDLIASFRRHGPCRWCGRPCSLCAHHLFAIGQAGGRRLDVPINLIALGMPLMCPCHLSHHDGNQPTFDDLLAISAHDNGCLQGDLEAVIFLIRRMPRISEMSKDRFKDIVNRELNFGARELAMKQLPSFAHLLER